METVFKWVHLSDVHFQTMDEGIQTELLREKLRLYLKKEVSGCNALLLSGDYRFAPSGEENPKKCSDYIVSLAKSLSIQNDQIAAVPGNHDLNRGNIRNYLIRGVLGEYKPAMGIIDHDVLTQLMSDFTFYYEFCNGIKDIHCLKNGELPHAIVSLGAYDVLLLNTSIVSGKDNETKQLVLASSTLHKILKERQSDNPIIALGHHSLSELNDDERKMVQELFEENGVCLYLCGHAHKPEIVSISDKLKEVTVGCLKQNENDVIATFTVGEITSEGDVKIYSHRWDPEEKNWFVDPPRNRTWPLLYKEKTTENNEAHLLIPVKKQYNPFTLEGYNLLGGLGIDGIKYFWSRNGKIVESVALNKRLRNSSNLEDMHTSAYTISSSIGCHLSAIGLQCRFCETGTMEFSGPLTARDIALQCIFMAEYDVNCPSYPEIKNNAREFAFMGQGEPGYNYPAIKNAIIMTDHVMEQLEQKVSRYIISTCGISDFMPSLIQDIRNKVYKNKVTVHFSLHAIGEERKELMPIESTHSYKEFIDYCKILYSVTGEKIGVGIMMFDQYSITNGRGKKYSLGVKKLKEILSCLDNNVFRIDLCTVNNTSAGRQTHQHSFEEANKLLEVVKQAGFEGKIFTSFGDTEQAGCGMLSSLTESKQEIGETSIKHFNKALDLMKDAEQYCIQMVKRNK